MTALENVLERKALFRSYSPEKTFFLSFKDNLQDDFIVLWIDQELNLMTVIKFVTC